MNVIPDLEISRLLTFKNTFYIFLKLDSLTFSFAVDRQNVFLRSSINVFMIS